MINEKWSLVGEHTKGHKVPEEQRGSKKCGRIMTHVKIQKSMPRKSPRAYAKVHP
jgi:hypothetical protein